MRSSPLDDMEILLVSIRSVSMLNSPQLRCLDVTHPRFVTSGDILLGRPFPTRCSADLRVIPQREYNPNFVIRNLDRTWSK